MNESDSMLIHWVKTISYHFNIIAPNAKNLLKLLYDDEFIYDFFVNFFVGVEQNDSIGDCIDVISYNILRFFEYFNFPKSQLDTIQTKVFDNWKEMKFKIWNMFITIAFINEFCPGNVNFINKEHIENTISSQHIKIINSNIPERCTIRFMIKSTWIFRSLISLINEFLSEIEIDFYEFQILINKFFQEDLNNETQLYYLDDEISQSNMKNNFNDIQLNTPTRSSVDSPIIPSTPVKGNGSPDLSFVDDYINLKKKRNSCFTSCEDCDVLKSKSEESEKVITKLKERINNYEEEIKSLKNYTSLLLVEKKNYECNKNDKDKLNLMKNYYEKQLQEIANERSILETIINEQNKIIENNKEELIKTKEFKSLFKEFKTKYEVLSKENTNLKSNLTNYQNFHINNLNFFNLEKREDHEGDISGKNEKIKLLENKLNSKDSEIVSLNKKIEKENYELQNMKKIILIFIFLIICLLNLH